MFTHHRPGRFTRAMLNAEKNFMAANKTYFFYIMTNRSKTLYTGFTNNLIRRVSEHKMGTGSCFAAKYKLDRLVYFERFEDVHNAIEREKEIKGWLRIKKIALIVSVNPAWRGLEPRVVQAARVSARDSRWTKRH